jgi:hypothetical protein
MSALALDGLTASRLRGCGAAAKAVHLRPGSDGVLCVHAWLLQVVAFSRRWEDLLLLSAEYDLCLTGARVHCVCGCVCAAPRVHVHASATAVARLRTSCVARCVY